MVLLRIGLRSIVICRIGSLENVYINDVIPVNVICRIGSLENAVVAEPV